MSDFIVDKLTKSVGDKTVFVRFPLPRLGPDRLDWVNGLETTLLDVLSGCFGSMEM